MMTKKTLGLVTFSAVSLLAAGLVLAQSVSLPSAAAAPAPAPKQQKLVKVCSLGTVQANQEFQGNVQIMQAERQQAVEANAAYEKETNAAKKKELKAKLDAMLAKLNEDNQKMIKTYGFSLDRTYTIAIEKADVYMLVSDEEAAKLEKQQAAAAKK